MNDIIVRARLDDSQLVERMKKMEREIRDARKGSMEYAKALRDARLEIAALRKQIDANTKSLENNTDAANENADAIGRVADAGNEVGGMSESLDFITESLGAAGGNAGQLAEGLSSVRNIMSKIGGKGGALGVLIVGLTLATVAAYQLDKAYKQLYRDAQKFSGLTGQSLRQFATDASALASVFDVELQDVFKGVNSLAKNFKMSFAESMDLIENGFINGADAGGDFIDKIKEYPIFFKRAGVSAKEFINIATVEATQGVYSDKLIDSIKELTIRFKEFDTAQAEALKPLGSDFVNNLVSDFNTGQKSITEVFKAIYEQSQKVGLTTKELQTIVADLGASALEDVGGIEKAYELLIMAEQEATAELTDYQKAQKKSLEVAQESEKVYSEMAKLVEGFSSLIDNAWNEAKLALLRETMQIINYIRRDQIKLEQQQQQFADVAATYNSELLNSAAYWSEAVAKQEESLAKSKELAAYEEKRLADMERSGKFSSDELELQRYKASEAKKYVASGMEALATAVEQAKVDGETIDKRMAALDKESSEYKLLAARKQELAKNAKAEAKAVEDTADGYKKITIQTAEKLKQDKYLMPNEKAFMKTVQQRVDMVKSGLGIETEIAKLRDGASDEERKRHATTVREMNERAKLTGMEVRMLEDGSTVLVSKLTNARAQAEAIKKVSEQLAGVGITREEQLQIEDTFLQMKREAEDAKSALASLRNEVGAAQAGLMEGIPAEVARVNNEIAGMVLAAQDEKRALRREVEDRQKEIRRDLLLNRANKAEAEAQISLLWGSANKRMQEIDKKLKLQTQQARKDLQQQIIAVFSEASPVAPTVEALDSVLEYYRSLDVLTSDLIDQLRESELKKMEAKREQLEYDRKIYALSLRKLGLDRTEMRQEMEFWERKRAIDEELLAFETQMLAFRRFGLDVFGIAEIRYKREQRALDEKAAESKRRTLTEERTQLEQNFVLQQEILAVQQQQALAEKDKAVAAAEEAVRLAEETVRRQRKADVDNEIAGKSPRTIAAEKELADQQAALDAAVRERETTIREGEAEVEKSETEHKKSLMENETEFTEFFKSEVERRNQIEEEQAQLRRESLKSMVESFKSAYRTITEALIAETDKQIEQQDRRIAKLLESDAEGRNALDKGRADAVEAEERRMAKLKKQREKFVAAQKALDLVEFASSSAVAIAKAAAQGGGFASVATVAAVIAAIAGGLGMVASMSGGFGGSFEEGGEIQGRNVFIRANEKGKEFVVNADSYRRAPNLVRAINDGKITDADYIGRVSGGGSASGGMTDRNIVERLERVERALNKREARTIIDGTTVREVVDRVDTRSRVVQRRR